MTFTPEGAEKIDLVLVDQRRGADRAAVIEAPCSRIENAPDLFTRLRIDAVECILRIVESAVGVGSPVEGPEGVTVSWADRTRPSIEALMVTVVFCVPLHITDAISSATGVVGVVSLTA